MSDYCSRTFLKVNEYNWNLEKAPYFNHYLFFYTWDWLQVPCVSPHYILIYQQSVADWMMLSLQLRYDFWLRLCIACFDDATVKSTINAYLYKKYANRIGPEVLCNLWRKCKPNVALVCKVVYNWSPCTLYNSSFFKRCIAYWKFITAPISSFSQCVR